MSAVSLSQIELLCDCVNAEDVNIIRAATECLSVRLLNKYLNRVCGI